ncbi:MULTISPECIES: hypothetical protein [unclassified Rhizobium]|uniref:hypothetical protein n=1 Tax=unclassified Rhizobium TaxID=2613769 RepID=UPI0009F1C178|nr:MULTISPECIES: hypothetical protein [unclassified Rhizobium]MDM9622183.1 hypothetical protein [Rhizobium sp. S96]
MSIVRQFDRLCAIRDQLEARLDLHEARFCLGGEDIDDGTERDLRERILEVREEISALEHRPRYFDL